MDRAELDWDVDGARGLCGLVKAYLSHCPNGLNTLDEIQEEVKLNSFKIGPNTK